MGDLVHTFFNIDVILRYLPNLVQGLLVTIGLSIGLTVLGLVLGTILAVIRSYAFKPVNVLIVVYADIFRALPPLMVLVLMYFGLPYAGIRMDGVTVSILGLGVVLAAFVEELVWSGIRALPKGQMEAARSTGLGHLHAMVYVIVPQAIRLMLPALVSRLIIMIKATSLASVVAVSDLIGSASAALGFSANASPLFAAALGYLIFLIPLVIWGRRFEARYKWGR